MGKLRPAGHSQPIRRLTGVRKSCNHDCMHFSLPYHALHPTRCRVGLIYKHHGHRRWSLPLLRLCSVSLHRSAVSQFVAASFLTGPLLNPVKLSGVDRTRWEIRQKINVIYAIYFLPFRKWNALQAMCSRSQLKILHYIITHDTRSKVNIGINTVVF